MDHPQQTLKSLEGPPVNIADNYILATLATLGPHPLVTISLAVGAFVAFLNYSSKGSVRDASIAFIVATIAAVTPLHVIVIPILVAVWTNRWLYERTENNGAALVLSFPVGIAVFAVLLHFMVVWGTIALFNPEPATPKQQLGGIVVLMFVLAPLYVVCAVVGLAGYVVVSTGMSVRRWRWPPEGYAGPEDPTPPAGTAVPVVPPQNEAIQAGGKAVPHDEWQAL